MNGFSYKALITTSRENSNISDLIRSYTFKLHLLQKLKCVLSFSTTCIHSQHGVPRNQIPFK
ncbi:hypothetical protein GOP47_0002512 [Adiantum capillus-veneris]|uniref:Uncharacterized protein n=1 Tax=Adiantum capillus-veneris TaxID=13818 RepID=A0A9D4VAH7_ADICA|nr:hypothetical protein GOP47_0002512 [Adiantum capillus-veneris]